MDLRKHEFEQWEKESRAQLERRIGRASQAEYHRPDNFYLMFLTPADAQ